MTVNWGGLAGEFFKQGKGFLLDKINKILLKKFENNKSELLEKIKSHPISEELKSHTTPSLFLSNSHGSLFGFIGFPFGEEPINELLDFLNDNIEFIPATSIDLRGLTRFSCSFPSIADFNNRFPLFWEPGRSWVYAIEDGISGLGYYISNKYGRSKEGVQVETLVNRSEFKTTPFLTPILNEFKSKMSK